MPHHWRTRQSEDLITFEFIIRLTGSALAGLKSTDRVLSAKSVMSEFVLHFPHHFIRVII
jgi:hypothetical protein